MFEDLDLQKKVFNPHWPEGLEIGKHTKFLCDDEGSDGKTWMKVVVGNDGDVHVSMQEMLDGKPYPLPSVRCRTKQGGGKHSRTRQALLWLARAIQLDNEEIGPGPDEYRCTRCKKIFDLGPNDTSEPEGEELDQLRQRFPDVDPKKCKRVCERCYAELCEEHANPPEKIRYVPEDLRKLFAK